MSFWRELGSKKIFFDKYCTSKTSTELEIGRKKYFLVQIFFFCSTCNKYQFLLPIHEEMEKYFPTQIVVEEPHSKRGFEQAFTESLNSGGLQYFCDT